MTDLRLPEARLGEVLKKQALQDTPAFSEALHQRVMTQVRAVEGTQGIMPVAAMVPTYRLWLRAGLAMAAALVVAVALWALARPAPVEPPKVAHSYEIPQLTPMQDIVADNIAAAQDKLEEGRYAYLDKDAKSLAYFVADQLDVLPVKR